MLDKSSLSNTLKGQSYHLYPGEILVSKKDLTINTVLGSCVAVCLWDKNKKIGGMNHIMLPRSPEGEFVTSRYGNVATFLLLDMFIKAGANKNVIQTRIFGGASALWKNSKDNNKSVLDVGAKNIEITKRVLKKLNLSIDANDIGGHIGRKISFDLNTGVIKMQYLKRFDFKKEIKDDELLLQSKKI